MPIGGRICHTQKNSHEVGFNLICVVYMKESERAVPEVFTSYLQSLRLNQNISLKGKGFFPYRHASPSSDLLNP